MERIIAKIANRLRFRFNQVCSYAMMSDKVIATIKTTSKASRMSCKMDEMHDEDKLKSNESKLS